MKYAEIKNIKTACEILGQDRLPIAYELAKNIKRCATVLKDIDELVQDLVKQYADKDDQGAVKYHPADAQGRQKPVLTEENEKLLQAEVDKLNEDDSHTVEFHKISETKVAGLSTRGDALAVLLGNVIEETDSKV